MRRLLAALAVALPLFGAASALPASASTQVFPQVQGSYGAKPKLVFSSATQPAGFEEKVLKKGTGPVVATHDLVVVNYYGQIWRGKVFDTNFDSSFKHHQLFDFAVGRSQVIKGWDQGLTGVHVGSRLLLVIPPSLGYGKGGNTGAGISGTDDLVFVVDVVADFSPKQGGDAHATGDKSVVNGVKIGGTLGHAALVHVNGSAPLPGSLGAYMVAKGNGPKVKAGLVVLQYVAVAWTSQVVGSTWVSGEPEGDPIGDSQQPSFYDPLVGFPVGSRVLLEIPKSSSGGPYAVVIDIIGQPTEPKVAK